MSQKPYLEAVRIVAAAAWADGEIAEDEARLVRQMIDVGPLDADEKSSARAFLHTRPGINSEQVSRLAMQTRADIYKSAVRVAAADGRTVRAERGFLKNLEEILALDQNTASEVRETVKAETAEKKATYAKLYRLPICTLDGDLTSLGTYEGKAMLLVNVASECGLTPQYQKLQALHEKYAGKGLVVVGFPCNQFGQQEPGSPEEIRSFCTSNYGVEFPLMEKIDVKGDRQHDIYAMLSEVADAEGQAGEVQWNFEKFVVAADGNTITRFRPQTEPDDAAVIAAIESGMPS